ncbi:MAG: hypothetical protein ISR39_01880 [Akkermansiaceae bacterium]|nr:hypothetical protein [Akkermansiaceae bacterium]
MEYYTEINRAINERPGDNTNPPLQVASLNQKQLYDLQRLEGWNTIAGLLIGRLKKLRSQPPLLLLQVHPIRSYYNSLQVNSLGRGFFQCPVFLT